MYTYFLNFSQFLKPFLKVLAILLSSQIKTGQSNPGKEFISWLSRNRLFFLLSISIRAKVTKKAFFIVILYKKSATWGENFKLKFNPYATKI